MHLRKYVGHILYFSSEKDLTREWLINKNLVKFKFAIRSSKVILKIHAYNLFMWIQIFVYRFMKNFVLIDQLKFTPNKWEFLYFVF